jgi:hypothetical protein
MLEGWEFGDEKSMGEKKKRKKSKSQENKYKGRVYARYGRGCTRDCVYMRMMEEWVSASDKGRGAFRLTW